MLGPCSRRAKSMMRAIVEGRKPGPRDNLLRDKYQAGATGSSCGLVRRPTNSEELVGREKTNQVGWSRRHPSKRGR